jgi:hypothetical protein
MSMATNEPPVPPTPSDVLYTLHQAARDLQSWMAHIEAFAADPNLGQVINAKRIGRIVRETVNEALCETQAIEHAALDEATLGVA